MGYYFDWLRLKFEMGEYIAEGFAKGYAEGQREARIEIALRLRSMGMDDQQIHKATELSFEEISNLDKEEEE